MKRVLVVGDIIADVYRECVFKKMCPDAPGVKAIVETSRDVRPGGAANVALNLAALAPNLRVDLIGCLDVDLARTIKYLSGSRVDMSRCVFDEPIRKERVFLEGRMLFRIDDRLEVSSGAADSVAESIGEYLTSVDPELIVLSDYGSGTVGVRSLGLLMDRRDSLLVDTKIADLSFFASGGRRTLLAKLNESEWEQALAMHHSPEEFFSFLVVTRGACGADLLMRRPGETSGTSVCQSIRVREHVVDEVDVCGCGDTFLAGLAAAMADGRDPHAAVQFANAAAATVVSKPRTAVADLGATIGLLGWDL